MGQIVDFLPFLILSQVEVISHELLAHTAENLTLKFVQFVSIEEFFLCERNHYLSKYMYRSIPIERAARGPQNACAL